MDVRIDGAKEHFKFRVCGVLTHNNKYLVVKIANNNFYCLPGGHVEIGEDTHAAVIREMKEELTYDVKIKQLLGIAQNLYTRDLGKEFHEIGYYYLVEAVNPKDIKTEDYVVTECDKGVYKRLEFKWFSLEELQSIDFKPEFAKVILNPNKMTHIINDHGKITCCESYIVE